MLVVVVAVTRGFPCHRNSIQGGGREDRVSVKVGLSRTAPNMAAMPNALCDAEFDCLFLRLSRLIVNPPVLLQIASSLACFEIDRILGLIFFWSSPGGLCHQNGRDY